MEKLEAKFKANGGEFREFCLDELFISSNGDSDIQQRHINSKGELVVSSGENEMGIIGRSDVKAKIFEANTLTIDMFGNVFYRNHSYKMVTHARVFSLKFKNPNFTAKAMLYVCTLMKWFKLKFSYSNMASWKKVKDLTIFLPTQKGKIAFEFMEDYIAELQAERVRELQAYLAAAGLSDYKLTKEEKEALNSFERLTNERERERERETRSKLKFSLYNAA
ncbi:restriction endonuclease subunit S [Campylobacter sp. MIT 99-7217]|uniref:restriction endonuclease subunit S n=1 Tax=Campylobacter sp. MIT 99-7217 TaxID=535091 RepID=UPI00115BEE8B|nr:restriction endonuclease subunit S [Campylobacter sp. MIT 99-7217]TQR34459.1 restriction endonuclease subunit S [Campylobacter sp. MIT 99-7217]